MRGLVITHSITKRDEKSTERYLSDIAKYEVLTPKEEVQLFHRIQAGDDSAFDKLVKHNLRFVVSVAKQYQHAGLKLGDLINEGNLGLMKAVRRYDASKGFKFISYAVWWIRQSILSALNERGRKIRLPSNQISTTRKLKRAISQFQQEEGRDPNMAELAAKTKLSLYAVQNSLNNEVRCDSLDAPIQQGETASMASFIEDDTITSPDHRLLNHVSNQVHVRTLLDGLKAKEATILALYFGIDRKYPKTLQDIGEYLGLSKERVRQIKDRSLIKLRLHQRRMEASIL